MDTDIPDFERFDHNDAWRLGQALVKHCQEQKFPVTICVTIGEQRVFHAALPGTSADNDAWVDRKARVVRRFNRPSMEVRDHYKILENPTFFEIFGLPRSEFAPGEGGVPIRVRGTQVGVLAVSGLESGGDNAIAMAGLRMAMDD